MADEEPKLAIPIADALEFIQSVDNLPVVGDLNARQVRDLKKLSLENWQSVWAEYRSWQKHITVIPDWGWLLVIVLSAIAAWFWDTRWALIGVAYGCYVLIQRAGVREGYGLGYEAGFEGGVNRALGLSDEQAAEISKQAREADVWGVVDPNRLRQKVVENTSPPPAPPQP